MKNKRIELSSSTSGLIFDCDGTLVDSMAIHMKAWEKTFEDFNETYRIDFLDPLKGMSEEAIIELYNKTFHRNADPKTMVDRKHQYFLKEIHGVRPIQPVVDVAHRFADKMPLAVVSGGRRETVSRSLEIIGIKDLFQVILTADDPFPPKPAPDLFLEAARRIHKDPKTCQVFEDGDLGLQAAREAGMTATDIRPHIGPYQSL